MPVTRYDACWAKRARWVLGIQNTVAVRQENKKSAGIRCHIPATVEAVNTRPGSHTLCLSLSSRDYFLIWGQRRTVRPLCRCVFAAAGCRCACAEEVRTQGELSSGRLCWSRPPEPWSPPVLLTRSSQAALTSPSLAWRGHNVRS